MKIVKEGDQWIQGGEAVSVQELSSCQDQCLQVKSRILIRKGQGFVKGEELFHFVT